VFLRSQSVPGLGLALLCTAASAAAQTAPDAPAAGRGFNPKTSLILQGTYADFSSEADAEVGGVLLGPETELRPAGFSLAETELVIEANVDDQYHGWATVALENEDGETVVAVEEAYVNTLALPAGLAVKAGRFFSDIGYQNRIHSHAWDFVDLPLVYRALLANQLNDDGVQVRWVAPTDLLVEVGAEALRGQEYPGGGDPRDRTNAVTGFVHLGGDLGVGGAWRLGLSHLDTDADGRATGEDVPTVFTGDSAVTILDLVFKWAQDGNPAKRNVVFNAEYFVREERGDLVANPDGADFDGDGLGDAPHASAYDGEQQGFYAQAVFQPVPRWRVGLRRDRLEADNVVTTGPLGELAVLADATYTPQRTTLMVDFSNSEFSRLRAQYSRDETRPAGEQDDQFLLQYVMSLGPHPAHHF
jgi:hypothetical protein